MYRGFLWLVLVLVLLQLGTNAQSCIALPKNGTRLVAIAMEAQFTPLQISVWNGRDYYPLELLKLERCVVTEAE